MCFSLFDLVIRLWVVFLIGIVVLSILTFPWSISLIAIRFYFLGIFKCLVRDSTGFYGIAPVSMAPNFMGIGYFGSSE